MRFSINLRGDLAKLSDAKLLERLKMAWQAYEAADEKLKGRKTSLWWSSRGLIRHPWAYRWLSWVGISGPAFTFFVGWYPAPPRDAVMAMHLAFCEIRDIQDEFERRRPRYRSAQ